MDKTELRLRCMEIAARAMPLPASTDGHWARPNTPLDLEAWALCVLRWVRDAEFSDAADDEGDHA